MPLCSRAKLSGTLARSTSCAATSATVTLGRAASPAQRSCAGRTELGQRGRVAAEQLDVQSTAPEHHLLQRAVDQLGADATGSPGLRVQLSNAAHELLDESRAYVARLGCHRTEQRWCNRQTAAVERG